MVTPCSTAYFHVNRISNDFSMNAQRLSNMSKASAYEYGYALDDYDCGGGYGDYDCHSYDDYDCDVGYDGCYDGYGVSYDFQRFHHCIRLYGLLMIV